VTQLNLDIGNNEKTQLTNHVEARNIEILHLREDVQNLQNQVHNLQAQNNQDEFNLDGLDLFFDQNAAFDPSVP
jgi:predicted  nucleic acid-binding Zn-ribbon protein